jgi:GNAT superfamily N-acetyltransferase
MGSASGYMERTGTSSSSERSGARRWYGLCLGMPPGDLPLVALLAEEPVAHIAPPLPPLERVLTERYCVNLGATATETVVQGVRCDEAGLPALIAEVRSLVLDRGHRQAIWFVGPSSRPPNLLALLRQAGFVPTTTPPWEPTYAAMIMTEPPTPPADKTISARRIETLDELMAGLRIDAAATGVSDDELQAMLAAAPSLFEVERREGQLTFLAFDETETPIGVATAALSPYGLELATGATLPDHRGRGAYRALVYARWLEATRRGTPALAVQAGANSRPILERLGFETICTLHAVTDPATCENSPSR